MGQWGEGGVVSSIASLIDSTCFMARPHSSTATQYQPFVKTIKKRRERWWSDLPRVHQFERVNHALNGLHELDRACAQLRPQVTTLPQPDPMFVRT